MGLHKNLVRLTLVLILLLPLGVSCQDQQEEVTESLKAIPNWPPRVFFNTDGNWAFNYLTNRDTKDLTVILDALQGTGVDIVTVLVGIDDDLSWRGSKYGELWGDATKNWDPDDDNTRDSVRRHGNVRRGASAREPGSHRR